VHLQFFESRGISVYRSAGFSVSSAGFQTCCIADFQVGQRHVVRIGSGFGNPRYSRLGSLRYTTTDEKGTPVTLLWGCDRRRRFSLAVYRKLEVANRESEVRSQKADPSEARFHSPRFASALPPSVFRPPASDFQLALTPETRFARGALAERVASQRRDPLHRACVQTTSARDWFVVEAGALICKRVDLRG